MKQQYSIFCDESGIIKERYMVLGGIILPHRKVKYIEEKIKDIKKALGFNVEHEMKYHILNNQKKLHLYQQVLDKTYLDRNNEIDFRCVIFDNHQVDHKNWQPSCEQIHHNQYGFYDQYYHFLYHQFVKTITDGVFYCFLDERFGKQTSSVLINRLYLRLSDSKGIGSQIQSIQNINSKKSGLVQLADLLTGLVGLEANDRKTSKEKNDLLEFFKVRKKLSKVSNTSYDKSFKVWRFNYELGVAKLNLDGLSVIED